MNNDNHPFQPKTGSILGVHYAKNNEVAIVIETLGRTSQKPLGYTIWHLWALVVVQ